MSRDGSYSVLGFFHGDESGDRDLRRRRLDESRLWLLPEWIAHHGFDGVVIDYHPEVEPLTRPYFAHHVCCDPRCPGGCNDDYM